MTDAEKRDRLWPLEGSFRCGDGFLAAPECLGCSFSSRARSYPVTLTLPQVNGGSLRRPPWRYNRGGDDMEGDASHADGSWGLVAGGSTEGPKYAHILRCVIHSEVVASDEDSFNKAATQFGDELSDWWALVSDWLGVLTLQDFAGLGRAQRSILHDSVHMWSGDSDGVRKGGVDYQVMTGGLHWVEILDRQRIELALALAAGNSSPHVEWLFLRDARSLLNAREYRRVVIDSCTAAELAVTAIIDTKFHAAGVSSATRNEQFAKHHGLAKLIELHNSFRSGTLPRRLFQEVGAPRNAAAHTGASSTEAEARTALSKAAEVVSLAYPLSAIAGTGITTGVIETPPQFGVLPRVDQSINLTRGNALHLTVEARRREVPPPRQPPVLTSSAASQRNSRRLWRRSS